MTKKHIISDASNVISFERDADFYYRAAESRLSSGNLLGALSMYYKALKLRPDDPIIILNTAALLSDMDCCEASTDMLLPLLSDTGSSEFFCHALYMLGHNYWNADLPIAARDCFSIVLDTYADNIPEEQLEAILDSIVMIESDDAYPPNRLHLYNAVEDVEKEVCEKAQMLFSDGKMEEARNLLLPFHKKYPDSVRIRSSLALAFLCNHEYKKCTELIEKYDYAKDTKTLCMHILSSKALNDTQAVDTDCEMLKALDPDDIDGCMRTSAVFMDIDRRLDAVRYARKAYELMPYEKNVIHRLAYVLYECGEYDEACSLWKRILKIIPNDYIAKYFYSACRETVSDGKPRPVCIEYGLPSSVSIERIQYITNMFSDAPNEMIKLWMDNDEYLCDSLIWAASTGFSILSKSLMYFIAGLGGKRAEYFFRKLLFDPYADNATKETALMLLARMGVKPPYLLCTGGRLIESSIKVMADANSSVPRGYRAIWKHIESALSAEEQSAVLNAAQIIYTRFIINYLGDVFPSMTPEQSIASACAIEYLARKSCENEITQDEMIEKYGITQRRFKNALDRVQQAIKPFFNETDGDDIE